MTKKPCFVISPIGEEGSETRKRADQILNHIIAPVADKCGFEAIRADKISEPGMITSQAIQHIIDDPLVIADLTGMNPNVFYELALRHAIRRPLVQIIQKGEKIPFDVADMRTISIDHRDLDGAAEAKLAIEKQILAIKDKLPEDIGTPISSALNLQSLKQSSNIEERSIAELITVVSDLRQDLQAIKYQMGQSNHRIDPELVRTIVKEAMRNGVQADEKKLKEVAQRLMKIVTKKKAGGSFGEGELEIASIENILEGFLCQSDDPQ